MNQKVEEPQRRERVAGCKTKRESSISDVSTSSSLISKTLKSELQCIWSTFRNKNIITSINNNNKNNISQINTEEVEVPEFKVGALEMYRRFPRQYDLLMQRHDCTAIKNYIYNLLSNLQKQQQQEEEEQKDNFKLLRVADFGCGTGRIASMMCQHPAVGSIYCYDSEKAMLKECFKNIVRSIAVGRPDACGIRICSIADNNNNNNKDENDECIYIGDIDNNNNNNIIIDLCVRPVGFEAARGEFINNHPSCHIIVCAWALSFVMRAQWGGDRWYPAIDSTLSALSSLLLNNNNNNNNSAAMIIIETLGTNTVEPRRRNTLAERLEIEHKFERLWVRTDYKFKNFKEAIRLTRFFFGEEMAQSLKAKEEKDEEVILPECTGIWTLWRS